MSATELNAPSANLSGSASVAANNNNKPVPVKTVLLGESAVGKTSLVMRLVNRDFRENREPTIGAAFLTHKSQLDDRTIKFEIWDTAGQERFHSLAPMYYRNAQAAIVVYDVTKAATLERAKSWIKELQRQANPHIVIALVGNKIDLAEENQADNEEQEEDDAASVGRQVPTEDAAAYASEAGLLFMETSAKTGHNVEEMFTEIAKNVPIEYIMYTRGGARGGNGPASGNPRIDLMREGPASGSGSSGCAC